VSNQLGAGLNEPQVLAAVEKSGYPLQTIVGDILRSDFDVQQEWCYVDRDSKELRAIDIHARRRLHDWESGPQPAFALNWTCWLSANSLNFPTCSFFLIANACRLTPLKWPG
jgi:hypothetical protein